MRTNVVIGANLAGGRAVEAMREAGFEGRIFLVGDEPDRPYERPPLSKEFLRGEADPETPYLRSEDWYRSNDIELILGVKATRLDPAGKVKLETGQSLEFDACLLATGGRPRRLEVPGSGLEGIHYLRTLQDSRVLAAALADRPRVAVVGAGFIGAEVAASARTVGCEVTMIEALPVPLSGVLGPDLGEMYAQIHRDHGVDVRLDEKVERFDGSEGVEAVVGASGQRYAADLVVVGVGMIPNAELAQDAGIDCMDGIFVDVSCRTSAPGVFAAGDVARRLEGYSNRVIRVEHFQNAQNQGAAAGRSMAGEQVDFQEVPWFWSDQYEHNLQMLGHPMPGNEPVMRGSLEDRDLIVIYLSRGQVVAALAINRPRDMAVARRLIERRVTVEPDVLADPDVSLRDLVRP